jgi:hypothetical protein
MPPLTHWAKCLSCPEFGLQRGVARDPTIGRESLWVVLYGRTTRWQIMVVPATLAPSRIRNPVRWKSRARVRASQPNVAATNQFE